MSNQGWGLGAGGQAQDFEQLARQYWAAWGDALRGAAPGSGQAGAHAWQDAIDWWTRYAHGNRSGINDALGRFNSQARDWYGHMQQVAAQFAGRDHVAGDIARAWKEALGASGSNPFPEMLRSMRGQGLAGLDQWVEDAAPWLEAVRGEGMAWLRLPAFGAGREHQEQLQALARAMVEYEEANSAYNALMLKASQRAFSVFEDKLAAREEPGRQIETPRALFDLWVDAAEEAYAEIALSQEFRQAYGALVNGQMRVRAGLQAQVERVCATLGMPTRTEVDAAHRKIVELERALRRLRDAVEDGPVGASGSGSARGDAAARSVAKSSGSARATKRAASGRASGGVGASTAARSAEVAESASGKPVPEKPRSKKAASKNATSKKTSPRKAAQKKTAQKKAASKKTASKKTASKKTASERPASKQPAPKKVAGSGSRPTASRRPARKLAPRPSVTARAPGNGFSSHIPIPDAPLPPDSAPAPAAASPARRGGR